MMIQIEECKAACLSEYTFYCKSFDYLEGEICYLSQRSLGDNNVKMIVNSDYTYYERELPVTSVRNWVWTQGIEISGGFIEKLSDFSV